MCKWLKKWWFNFTNGNDRIDKIPKQAEELYKLDYGASQMYEYYPHATPLYKGVTRGEYPEGYPEGCVIHYNAGNDNSKNFLHFMREKGLLAILIDKKGHVWQDAPLNKWGYHAGSSAWGDMFNLNNRFIGIEVMSAGKLEKKGPGLYSWWGKNVPLEDVLFSENQANIDEGFYEKFNDIQMKELVDLILWLEHNGKGVFKLENVVGHDEVSPGRKSDPGGALNANGKALTMPKFRTMLKEIKDKEKFTN